MKPSRSCSVVSQPDADEPPPPKHAPERELSSIVSDLEILLSAPASEQEQQERDRGIYVSIDAINEILREDRV